MITALLAAFLFWPDDAQTLIESGMRKFIAGKIAESVADFDQAARADPSVEAQLWQRGIAYFYLGRFEEGRRQFEIHRTVNPADVENTAWWYLCMARLGRRA